MSLSLRLVYPRRSSSKRARTLTCAKKAMPRMSPNEKLLKSRTGFASVPVMRTEKSAIAVKTLISKLTTAERRILSLVSLAKTNKEIAVALGISPATVKRHLENVLRKLELRNRVEAAILWTHRQWMS